ncbi:ribbon-helix-helix protein, CopG family [Candidatus Bathyarchaeota archaeon]|nr:ribbon-helix-helix protein, CopG family [Candidatus Bathyarchaeota archaeon]
MTVTLDDDNMARISSLAKVEHRSMANLTRILLREALEARACKRAPSKSSGREAGSKAGGSI